jgi:hypothetical protein
MVLEMPCNKEMLEAARATAAGFTVQEGRVNTVPTPTQMALARGYKAMSIIGLDTHGCPPRWNDTTDLITGVDRTQILQAANFAEALMRKLANTLPER